MALPLQVNSTNNLCLSEYSTAEELDMLFNNKDGILADDTFIGIMGDGGDDLGIDKAFDADDLFSQLMNVDAVVQPTQNDHAYSRDQQLCRSPLNSDSGISLDSCQRSPEYIMSDNQSEPSPGKPDNGSLDGVFLETVDLSSVLTGSDSMLLEDSTVSTTTHDLSSGDDDSTNGIIIETISYGNDLMLTTKESQQPGLPMTVQDTNQCHDANSKYHLVLTNEEKRLLKEMSVELPTDMPLTKEEERSLKAVRRKIRNKASAQNSRKKKKEYVDGLEHRVQMCTRHNLVLQKKMDRLEKDNRTLLDQLKSLQSLVSKSTTKAAQASTCVMVLLFSFALLVAPSFNPFASGPQESYEPNGVVSRTLKHVEVPDADIYHADSVNLGTPPQSYATDQPMGRISKSMGVVEDFPDEEVETRIVEEDDIKSKKDVLPSENEDKVVESENETKKNNNTVVVNMNKVDISEKVATADTPQTNHAGVKTKTDRTVKHAGDEM